MKRETCLFFRTNINPMRYSVFNKIADIKFISRTGKDVEFILQLQMEFFGIMETHRILCQWKEQGSVKVLENVTCFN